MKKYTYIAIAIMMFSTSCENEIPFNIKDTPPKLIVNALLDSEKEENGIILALTGRENISFVKDATIEIFINGQVKEQLTTVEKSDGTYSPEVFKSRLRFVPDDVIRIEARTNDGKYTAWSEVVVPHPIAIERVDTTTLVLNSQWGGFKILRVKTTFTDNGNDKNFYRIVLEKHLTIDTKSPHTGNDTIIKYAIADYLSVREDVVLTDGRPSTNEDNDNGLVSPVENRYGVFDNSRINGTYTMITSIPYEYYLYPFDPVQFPAGTPDIKEVSVDVKVKLMSISRMQYFYLKALNIYDSVDYDDYFNLPVKLPTNVEGGTGIVGVSTESNYIFHLYKHKPEPFS